MDRNIIMAIAAVALIAAVFIGLAIFRQPDNCPGDIQIHTEKTSYEIGEEVHLSLKSAGKLPRISIYEWTTEDGQISNQPSPVFVFNEKNTQQVLLKINEGCEYRHVFEILNVTDEDIDEIIVTEGSISISKKTAFAGDPIQFKDNSEGASAHWWDFGDANSSSLQNPTHIYTRPGTYTVSRMLNGDENMVETTKITIKKRNTPPKKDPNKTAAFGVSKTNAPAGEIIQFTDKTPNAKSWLWNFGDGYTSQERNPAHVYNFAGNYIVMLSVNGTGKNVSTQTINVAPRIVTTTTSTASTANDLPPPPPPLPIKMDLATTLKTKFQEIAGSSNDELKTNIYYNDLLPNVADENMPVNITRNGQQIEDTFYDYYNSLNIQGGQRIARVEVLKTDAEGKATALRVIEQ